MDCKIVTQEAMRNKKIFVNNAFIIGMLVVFSLNGVVFSQYTTVINGLVQSENGISIQGAEVFLVAAWNDSTLYSVQTNSTGMFQFVNVNSQEYKFKINASGYPLQWYELLGNTLYPQYKMWFGTMLMDTVRIKMLINPTDNKPSSQIKVNVFDTAGRPMYSLAYMVSLLREHDRTELKLNKTDSSNLYIFQNVQPGGYSVHLMIPSYPDQYFDTLGNTSYSNYFKVVGINDTVSINVYLTMRPHGRGLITGKCMSASGSVLTTLSLLLYKTYDTLAPVYTTTTDINGVFLFDKIIEQSYYLKIRGGGYPDQWYLPNKKTVARYPEGSLFASIAMTFVDTMFIAVSQIPLDNAPRSNVRVIIKDQYDLPLKVPGELTLISNQSRAPYSMALDSSGWEYKISNIAAGGYSLRITIPGYPVQYYSPSSNTQFENYYLYLNANDSLVFYVKPIKNFIDTTGTTVTGSYGYVKGVVKDSTGIPIKNVTVMLYSSSGTIEGSMTTDSLGVFPPIRVPSLRTYNIFIPAVSGFPSQYWSMYGNCAAAGPNTQFMLMTNETLFFDVKLIKQIKNDSVPDTSSVPNGTYVSGTVKGSDGKPIKGIIVSLYSSNLYNQNFNPRYFNSPYQSRSDSTGSVIFKNIPRGEYFAYTGSDSLNLIGQYYKNADEINNVQKFTVDSSLIDLSFILRKGGFVRGTVKTVSGQPVGGARINANLLNNKRSYEAQSDSLGNYQLKGMLAGTYSIFVSHNNYTTVNVQQSPQYLVSEGMETAANELVMEPGGFIAGTFNSEISLFDSVSTGSKLSRGMLRLYRDTLMDTNQVSRWMDFSTGLSFVPNSNSLLQGSFTSDISKKGKYRVLYSPDPISRNSAVTTNISTIVQTSGWGFLTGSTGAPAVIFIGMTDTAKGYFLAVKKGYSVFGQLRNEDGTPYKGAFFNIGVFAKIDGKYLCVSNSYSMSNGKFELPGLVDGEEYCFEINSDSYPHQYWSGQGVNTTNLSVPWKFTVANAVVPDIKLTKNPIGSGGPKLNEILNTWVEIIATGPAVIKWSCPDTLKVDTFKLYSIDRSSKVQLLAAVSKISGIQNYEFKETRILESSVNYTVTAKGNNVFQRSNIYTYNPVSSSTKFWLDAFTSSSGIDLQIGINDSTLGVAQTDSLSIYRKGSGGLWKLIRKVNGYQSWCKDDGWSRLDSGKTFEYKAEYPSKGLVSNLKAVTLDAQFFARLAKQLTVGPYEHFTTIQSAIDAAGQFDNVQVRAGIYKENLNLKGKVVNIHGEWEFGKPPILDGSGGVAITIPYTGNSLMSERVNVSGLKIQNATAGILTEDAVNIHNCLFVSTAQSIVNKIDTAKVYSASMNNPFILNTIEINSNQCTFIASKSGDVAFTANSANSSQAAQNGSFGFIEHFPVTSVTANYRSENNLFAYYYSRGGLSSVPLKTTGFSSIALVNSNFFETAVSLPAQGITSEKSQTVNPNFVDTVYYFLPDVSVLRTASSTIGYDGYRMYSNQNISKGPTAVKNLIRRIVGMDAISLKWDPSPVEEKVAFYKIYRIPADTALFYVNDKSQWEPKVPHDSMGAVMDTFTTKSTLYVDSTIVLGKEYVYVVAAVDSNYFEGPVELPAPPMLSAYTINSYQYEMKIMADKWYLVSPWGTSQLEIPPQGNQILYRWDDTRVSDKLYSQYIQVSAMEPGKGYWLKSFKDTVLKVKNPVLTDLKRQQDSLKVAVVKGNSGWNQIASPLPFPVAPSWLSKVPVWEWNADSSGYKRAFQLVPWQAYWLHVDRDTVLPLRDKNSSFAMAKRATSAQWELQVSLSGKGLWDLENYCGVTQSGLNKGRVETDVLEPPQAFGSGQIYFVNNKEKSGTLLAERLSYQYKESSPVPQKKIEWMVGVSASDKQSVVKVTNIESVPEGVYVFWVDQSRTFDLKKNSEILIPAHSETIYGYIVATANLSEIGIYTGKFFVRSPYPNPFRNSTVIEYSVPYIWSVNGMQIGGADQLVSIDIYDILGRHTGQLFKGNVAVGAHRFVWTGQDQKKRSVPAGFYIMKINCADMSKVVKLFRVR